MAVGTHSSTDGTPARTSGDGSATWSPSCWVNGRPADPSAPALSVLDRGFTLADGCFETMRVSRGVIVRLSAHLARLANTADRLGIPQPPHLEQTISDAVRVLRARQLDAAVRLTISRGVGRGVLPPSGVAPTTVLMIDHPPTYPPSLRTRGLSVSIAAGRRNERAATAGLKTLAYTDAVLALAAARSRGDDDALVLDTEGHLSEGTSSNLFLIIRGVVHTPPRSCGILPGITRAAVIEILAALDLPVEETPIPTAALTAADEIFLTSSLRGIAPVTTVGDRPVGRGTVGPITHQVLQAYDTLVATEVADHLALSHDGP